jgi:hypothetical protein
MIAENCRQGGGQLAAGHINTESKYLIEENLDVERGSVKQIVRRHYLPD